MAAYNVSFTTDAATILDSQTSATGTVTSSGLDLGGLDHIQNMIAVIDITAATVTAGDNYTFQFHLSDTSDFTSGTRFEKASISMGAASEHGGNGGIGAGRYVVPLNNEFFGNPWQYVRVSMISTQGTISYSVSLTAQGGN